jgi:ribosomal protein S18 acetylase RimI-like enzyme
MDAVKLHKAASSSLPGLTMHIDERVKAFAYLARGADARSRSTAAAVICLPLPPWKIRSATDEDIAAVLELWARAGGTPSVSDTPEALSLLLAGHPGALLLAEADGAVLGSLIAAWDGWRGSFYRLAVDPASRRLGIATAMLREGERRLRDLGAVRLTAIVSNEDPTAVAFWEAAGYARQRDRIRFVRPAGG